MEPSKGQNTGDFVICDLEFPIYDFCCVISVKCGRSGAIGDIICEVLTTFFAKQSQFENGRVNVSSFLKKDYGNGPRFEGLKNKANSKPIRRPPAGNPKQIQGTRAKP